jgi:hypothetical protein
VEDPPITLSGGSGGSIAQGGDAGESTGGRDTGGSGGTSSGGGSDGGCNDDGDCEFRIDGRSRCSVVTGECVSCLSPSDCDGYAECVDNECRPITTCSTAEDCPPGLVCSSSTARCVECNTASDCAASEICVSSTCRERCSVDSHCAPTGQRCDTGTGYCVDCLGHSDCDESRHCDATTNTCMRDVCVGGSSTCEGNGYVGCDESGSMEIGFVPCSSAQSCVEDDDGARCENWVCTPTSLPYCSTTEEVVLTCSEDGLTEVVEEDCGAAMQLCYGGVCINAVCTPNATFCAGTEVRSCNSAGTMSYLVATCPTNQRCNPATTMCAPQFCTPNQPACDGNVFTTCSPDGFGYTGERTDCTATDQFCGPTGCTTSVVDMIPASPTLYSGTGAYIMLNYYSVTSARNLALIEYYMNPTSAISLVWVVYESTTTQTGPYNRIHMSTTTSTTGEGFQSSGAVAVPLVAGRFYAIGVSWATASGFSYYSATASQTTSFGALIGGYVTTGTLTPSTTAPSPVTSNYSSQRLTTVP